MGRIWVCRKKYGDSVDFFITENRDYSRDARKNGYRCDRLHELEKAVYGETTIRHRRRRRRRR